MVIRRKLVVLMQIAFSSARLLSAGLAVAFVLLSACGYETPDYVEPDKPEEELARLETRVHVPGGSLFKQMSAGIGVITAVDGISNANDWSVGSISILVEPGRREIEAQLRTAHGQSTAAGEALDAVLGTPGASASYVILGTTNTLNATLEAGQVYEVLFERSGSTISVQIFRKNDGFPVSKPVRSKIGYIEKI